MDSNSTDFRSIQTSYPTVTAVWLTERPSSRRDYVITLDAVFYDAVVGEII